MTARLGRFLLASVVVITGGWFFDGLLSVSGAPAAHHAANGPTACAEVAPGRRELGVDLGHGDQPLSPGRVLRLSDGTIAVLLLVTATSADGHATTVDISASRPITAVILQAGTDVTVLPFDPPQRTAAHLTPREGGGIDHLTICYRVQLPDPPLSGATVVPASPFAAGPAPSTQAATPPATATVTPETFDLVVVQTAQALEATATAVQGTSAALATEAVAAEETRQAGATAAQATVAALATEQAADLASTVAQATAAVATQAAVQATASAELAAAQATTAALVATDVARQTEIAAAQVTTTPSPPAETRLLSIPETDTFDDWVASLPAGWTVTDGSLIADGQPFQGYVDVPQTMDGETYAVEIEARIGAEPACGSSFGLLVRGSEAGYNAGGVEWVCGSGPVMRLWRHDSLLAEQPRPLDQDWHTYRVTVDGDQITVALDGAVVVEATDPGGPAGTQLALWSSGVPLEVRAFRLIAPG